MLKLYTRVKGFFTKKEEGASMAEYAVLIALITLALVAAITHFRQAIITVFNDVTTALGNR
jgi:Flp pilus assembly pilin Flp